MSRHSLLGGRSVILSCVVISAVLGACADKPTEQARTSAGMSTTSAPAPGAERAPDEGAGSTTTTVSGQSRQTKAGTATSKPPEQGARQSNGQPATTSTTLPPEGERLDGTEGFPLEARVSPKCVTRGDSVLVVVTTRPWSAIAAAVAYSDSEAHGAYKIGAADGEGVWQWTFVVEPDAPDGPAQVLISAQDRSADSNDEGAKTTGEGAVGRYPLKVAPRCN